MTVQTSADQRMEPRWVLKSTVSVFQTDTKEYLGLLVNCSTAGLMLSTYQPMEPGITITIDLVDIPPNIDGRRTGQCTAEVMWSDQLTPSLYGSGCRVIEATDIMRSMMKQYTHS